MSKIQDEIIEEFSIFNDWLDRYDYLIELGNELPKMNSEFKTDEYLINGCQSKVWLNADYKDGKVWYYADSDAIIVRGIVALLVKAMNGQAPKEIIENELYFIDEIGLKQNLSPTRSNGLVAMVKKMRLYAIAYQAKFG
ncbi:MAG: SufE family protein [Bacteroidales bacterium]|jgi:cysteine desulfuration protein SufE|nr:SufE family protein [Bacteroidales bacterium]